MHCEYFAARCRQRLSSRGQCRLVATTDDNPGTLGRGIGRDLVPDPARSTGDDKYLAVKLQVDGYLLLNGVCTRLGGLLPAQNAPSQQDGKTIQYKANSAEQDGDRHAQIAINAVERGEN